MGRYSKFDASQRHQICKIPQTLTPQRRWQPKRAERQHNSNLIPCQFLHPLNPPLTRRAPELQPFHFRFPKSPFNKEQCQTAPYIQFISKMPLTPVAWQSKTALQNTMPEQQRPDMRGSTMFTLSLVDRPWLTVWTRDALCLYHLQRR